MTHAMSRRGSIVIPLLVLLAIILAGVAVVSMRLESEQASQAASERRAQAIWLARSALLAGRGGEVRAGGVTAHVAVSGGASTAKIPGGGTATARRDASSWTEGYDRTP